MKTRKTWFVDLVVDVTVTVLYVFVVIYSAITGLILLWKLQAIDDRGPIAGVRSLLNLLRPSNLFGRWDITELIKKATPVLIVCSILVFVFWIKTDKQETSIHIETPAPFTEVSQLPLQPDSSEVVPMIIKRPGPTEDDAEPYCFDQSMVIWNGVAYFAKSRNFTFGEAEPMFQSQLYNVYAYIPEKVWGIGYQPTEIDGHIISNEGSLYLDGHFCSPSFP